MSEYKTRATVRCLCDKRVQLRINVTVDPIDDNNSVIITQT